MLGTYLSVLKAERAAKLRAIEQMDAGKPGGSPGGSDDIRARFREQIAELDDMVASIEARLG